MPLDCGEGGTGLCDACSVLWAQARVAVDTQLPPVIPADRVLRVVHGESYVQEYLVPDGFGPRQWLKVRVRQ